MGAFYRDRSESISRGIVPRKVPSSIYLSGLCPIPSRGEGVPPEAVLFHGQPNPRPSVGHGVSRAHQPERTHAGRDRRGDPFLRESAQAGGLVRRRGRQMGEDAVGRGIEPLPAVPPRHAKGLGKVHLSIWKTELFAARFLSKLILSDRDRTHPSQNESSVLDGRPRLEAAGSAVPAQSRSKDFSLR